MKKLILVGLAIMFLLISTNCFAKKDLQIKIVNAAKEALIVTIDSIDHGMKIKGRLYHRNIPIFGAEMEPYKYHSLQSRKHGVSPYRYKLTVMRRIDNIWKTKKTIIFKIDLSVKNYLIMINCLNGDISAKELKY